MKSYITGRSLISITSTVNDFEVDSTWSDIVIWNSYVLSPLSSAGCSKLGKSRKNRFPLESILNLFWSRPPDISKEMTSLSWSLELILPTRFLFSLELKEFLLEKVGASLISLIVIVILWFVVFSPSVAVTVNLNSDF